MSLMDDLKAPEPEPVLVAELTKLAKDITGRIRDGEDRRSLIEEVQRLTGRHEYDEAYFDALEGWSSPEEFGRSAARGPVRPISRITREQVSDLISLASEIDVLEASHYLDVLERSLPFSEVSDLVFYPDRDRTFDEMAEEALIRDGIGRRGGKAAVNVRLREQANAVLANPEAPPWAVQWAEGVLTASSPRSRHPSQ